MTRPCFGLPHHTAVTIMNCKHQLCSHQLRPAEMLESRHQTSLETKILVLVSISGVWSPSQFQEQNSGLRLGLGVWSWFRSQRFGLSLDLSPEDLFWSLSQGLGLKCSNFAKSLWPLVIITRETLQYGHTTTTCHHLSERLPGC